MANNKENKNRHEFTIKVEKEEWGKLIDEAFNEVVKNAKVDGFRKGKVPRDVFDKKYGKQEYLVEAANHAVEANFKKLMMENDYKLVAEPQIHITKMDEEVLEFTMALIEQPEVNVKKYKGLNIKREDATVTDEEIDHEIHHLLEHYSEMVVKESDVVENNDTAVIDFEGFNNGVAFDGGKSENYPLEIGSGSFIPGFEEQIIGMKRGEEKDINVTFPEEYHASDLAGKPVVFKVKVNDIKVKKERELDSEFFEDLGMPNVNDEKSLREEIKNHLEEHKKAEVENRYIDAIIDAVSKNTEVDIPEEMVYDVTENMMKDLKQRLAMQGIDYNMYLTYSGQTDEQIKAEMEKQAFSRTLARLAIEKIKELENITVTDEEVDNKVKEMANEYKVSEEEVLKQIGNKYLLKYDLEMNKTIDFLREANK